MYKLHRETYYLAMDYFDRYLSNCEPISNDKLQLIGNNKLLMIKHYKNKFTSF